MDWQTLVPFIPFFASFFGVLAAFFFQWLGREYDRGQDRTKFLRDIKHEFETASSLLTGAGQLLPTDMWESGKASGFLSLLSYEVKFKLANTYFAVRSHNYEAEKVRDVGIQSQLTRDEKSKEDTDRIRLWSLLSVRAVETEKALKKHIDDLLKENIWGAKSVAAEEHTQSESVMSAQKNQRLHRFDTVFRTLLVIASILISGAIGFYRGLLPSDLFVPMILLFVVSICLWALGTLVGTLNEAYVKLISWWALMAAFLAFPLRLLFYQTRTVPKFVTSTIFVGSFLLTYPMFGYFRDLATAHDLKFLKVVILAAVVTVVVVDVIFV